MTEITGHGPEVELARQAHARLEAEWTDVGPTEGGVTLQAPIKWHLVEFPACGHKAWVPSTTVAQHIMAQSNPMACPVCYVVSTAWKAWSESWLRERGHVCRKCGQVVTSDQAGNWCDVTGSHNCEGDAQHRLDDAA
jgi:hypothetical protein